MSNHAVKILWKNPVEHINVICADGERIIAPIATSEKLNSVVAVFDLPVDMNDNCIISVKSEFASFSFFLRDVCCDWPIFIPEYGVVVTESADNRTYEDVEQDIAKKKLVIKQKKYNLFPESNYEQAAQLSRELKCPTIHGIAGDMRVFDVGFKGVCRPSDRHCWIAPRLAGTAVDRGGYNNVRYEFSVGRGFSSINDTKRWNEERVLPIINAVCSEESVGYNIQMFCASERTMIESAEGSNCYVAYKFSPISNPVPWLNEDVIDNELNREYEVVAFLRIIAENTADTLKYCFVSSPFPDAIDPLFHGSGYGGENPIANLDGKTGIAYFKNTGEAFMTATLNGKPLKQFENAVLLAPGEKAVFEYYIPHNCLNEERAKILSKVSYDEKRAECIAYWKALLEPATKFMLPEKRIEEMSKAALLHMRLLSYGKQSEPLAIGCGYTYAPLENEVFPIICYYDTMGWRDEAERGIEFFLNMQDENGYINCYYHVSLGNGYVLCMVNEHFRYTRDLEWLRKIRNKLIPVADNLIRRMEQNLVGDPKQAGYGMLDGRTGDPADAFHSYMLNASAWKGLTGLAELLGELNDPEQDRIARAADCLYHNIRENVMRAFERAPVVPLENGTWAPALAPFPNHRGPVCIHGENEFTRGTPINSDALIGSSWLAVFGVLKPEEPYYHFIMNVQHELYTCNGSGFVQPYYLPYPYIDLLCGNTSAFLKEFYGTMAALADRETYTFWEGYEHGGEDKIHEEAMFALRIRWMLYLEDGDTLKLLSGIPRKYLSSDIIVENAVTYFGKICFEIHPKRDEIFVRCQITSNGSDLPKRLTVRLPHPDGKKAVSVSCGQYSADEETVSVELCGDSIEFTLKF